MRELLASLPQHGQVVWIGLRPARREPPQVVDAVEAREAVGLIGDRFSGTPQSKRQVTLIQAEHLDVIALLLNRGSVDPSALRRNIVVRGINLLALKGARFKIGAAEFAGSGACHPCSRMEETFGPGGYNAVRGHGGITARVIQGGWIRLHDEVRLLQPAPLGEQEN
jgi:MOSC domain-containing protein YiiM